MTKTRSTQLIGALFTALCLASTASATMVGFANSSAITIPTSGKASPYPSSIAVAGIVETVVDVNITLTGLSHTYASDVYLVLEGPTGQALVLMNDAGGNTALFSANIVFDDEALNPIPQFGAFGSGSYQVSQYDSPPQGTADTEPAPRPGFGGDLSLFDGLDPNGDWNLYVYDDAPGDDGDIANGWSITFETQPIPEPTAAVLFALGTFVVGGTLRRRRA